MLGAASPLPPAALTAHKGGKKASPTGRSQRCASTSPLPLRSFGGSRVCSPRAHSGLPHVVYLGRSASGFWLHPSVSPYLHHLLDYLRPQLVHLLIHRRFDLGPRCMRVLFPPWRHPQDVSQSCAHEARIWGLRSPLFFLAFMLSFLSWSFFPYFITSLLCAKKDPVGERLSEQEQQSVRHEYHRAEYASTKREGEKSS